MSYLTARPSADLVVAAHQKLTVEWWKQHRSRFQLFVSQLVLDEAARGDRSASVRRLSTLADIPLLGLTTDAVELAKLLVETRLIPKNAVEDALHVALATVHGMDYLLTWNCRHIANAEIASKLAGACEESGYEMPVLCTPEQLMGD